MYCLYYAMPRKAKKNVEQIYHIRRAVNLTKTAIEQNDKRLTNPELFSKTNQATQSPLHWRHRSADLCELITILHLNQSFEYANGDSVTFTDVVRCAEQFLNIKLGDARDVKRSILDRKVNITKFLDTLRNQTQKK